MSTHIYIAHVSACMCVNVRVRVCVCVCYCYFVYPSRTVCLGNKSHPCHSRKKKVIRVILFFAPRFFFSWSLLTSSSFPHLLYHFIIDNGPLFIKLASHKKVWSGSNLFLFLGTFDKYKPNFLLPYYVQANQHMTQTLRTEYDFMQLGLVD